MIDRDNDRMRHQTTVLMAGKVPALVCLATWLVGCASLSPEEIVETRQALDEISESVLTGLFEKYPESRAAFDDCVGYAVADMRLTKIPVFGTAKGLAIVIDRIDGDREYVSVSHIEIGGGLGTQRYKVVLLFEDAALLERAMTGFWHFDANAEAAAGESGVAGRVSSGDGYHAYKIAEDGAVALMTVRAIRAKPL